MLSLAFVASAVVENEMVKEDKAVSTIPPQESHLMIINGIPDPKCKIEFRVGDDWHSLNFNQSKSFESFAHLQTLKFSSFS